MKSEICPKCGFKRLELLQTNQYACKECCTLFILSDMTDDEIMEWFID
jgi:hypothetical protein